MPTKTRQGPSPAVVAGALAGLALPALALAAATLPPVAGIAVPWGTADTRAAPLRLPPGLAAAHAPSPPKSTLRAGPLPTGSDAALPDLAMPAPATATAILAAGAGRAGGLGLGMAGLLVPFGATGWLQADAIAGSSGRGPFGGLALQAVAGDPRLAAAGLYAGASSQPAGGVFRLGVTGLVTRGALSAVGTLGYEDVAGRPAFFDMVDLVYRPFPTLALSVGHRRMDGRDLAAAGVSAEVGGGVSLVGEGRFGPGLAGRDPEVAALLGLRFGLGGPAPATLPSRLVDDALVPPQPRRR